MRSVIRRPGESSGPPSSGLPMGRREFVILMALLISLAALSTDIILPALGDIAGDLGLRDGNSRQMVLTVLFAGMAIGQFLSGIVSDSVGRKPVIMTGAIVFIAGCIISALAGSAGSMLAGRFLQGLGAAAPRVVVIAIVRDRSRGQDMAALMSLVMAIFITIPMLAPALGQGVLWLGNWRWIFLLMAGLCLATGSWFLVRHPETLPVPNPFRPRELVLSIRQILSVRRTVAYTIAGGLCLGPLLGYVVTAQQVFQDIYRTGDFFILWFALPALSLLLANLCNSRLVRSFPMERICQFGVSAGAAWALAFVLAGTVFPGSLVLWVWMVAICPTLFFFGLTFGNYNAIALEPLGHVAGSAAAITATASTLTGAGVAAGIGMFLGDTPLPVLAGHVVTGLVALSLMVLVQGDAPGRD